MTDEKKPPQWVVYHEAHHWEVQQYLDGAVTLTIYKGLRPAVVEMTADDALFLAYTLLTNGRDDFDLAAVTQRLSSLVPTYQIVTHSHDSFSPGELAVGHDDIVNAKSELRAAESTLAVLQLRQISGRP